MKNLKGLLLAVILMLTVNALMAQTYTETALMFSRTKPAGSARILGMGGAQISLGGDISSAYSNPAGLGMYNRSEFSITPGYYQLQNTGSYFVGNSLVSEGNTDMKSSLSIPAFGLIFSRPKDDEGFIHGTFGVTATRLNDFNSNLNYGGTNNSNSLINYFLNEANGGTPDQFGSGGDLYNTVTELAYDNFLVGEASIIDPDFPSDEYFTDFDRDINPNVLQEETMQTKGAQNQWSFSYGANFNDKFFLGAGLGIVALNFQSQKVYKETFTNQPINNYSLTEDLQIRGTGINVTIGAIGRPIDGLQIGGAVTTPTRYNLTDTYAASMRSNWNNFDYYGDGSEILASEQAATDDITSGYTFRTPWKFAAGASYVFGKSGLISFDIERLNYGGSKYNSQTTGVSYEADNDEISQLYASRTNYRLGGEYRIKSFRVRGGANYMPDPFKDEQNDVSRSRVSASAGVGYRVSKFYIDLAYIKSWGSNTYRPYTLGNGDSPLLKYDQLSSNVVGTIGFTF
ncbi:MAG TPA: hypothetical protein VK508_16770 [Cyclobacteriaceae bacterium]|nr:hypothetical protein [Cyclobacteriaceae bacterium]